MKVLFLTPWYPSEKDKMSGLFVQKHVEAVRAQGVDVRVIFSQTWWDTWRQWRALQREGWLPDVVQLNVIQKQGVLALWLKRRYKIPYVIIEHWTGYLPEHLSIRSNGLHTWFMKLICKEAEVVMPVSEHLGAAMRSLGFCAKKWQKINNVVEDFFYQSSRTGSVSIRFLHVSCMDEAHKNIKGILRAFKTLTETRRDIHLTIVGVSADQRELLAYTDELRLSAEQVRWAGELAPEEVAKTFDNTDIFVLNSNYENAPVVISESLAKGVPVISTNVGGIPEMVNAQCGILIAPKKDQELLEAMQYMCNHYREFDRDIIRHAGRAYSFEAVGKQLKEIYDEALNG